MARRDSVRTKALEGLIGGLVAVANHLESLADRAKPRQAALDLMLEVGRLRVIIEGISHEYRCGADRTFMPKWLRMASFVATNLAAGSVQLIPMVVTQHILDSSASRIEEVLSDFEKTMMAMDRSPIDGEAAWTDEDDTMEAHGTVGDPAITEVRSTTGRLDLGLSATGSSHSSGSADVTLEQGSTTEAQDVELPTIPSTSDVTPPSVSVSATVSPATIRTGVTMPPVTASGASVPVDPAELRLEGQEVTPLLGRAVEQDTSGCCRSPLARCRS